MAIHDASSTSAAEGASLDFTQLNPAQADGLACVVCGADYLAVHRAHQPVGRSLAGSQVFACSLTCVDSVGDPQ
jgi:hypothetical protein